MFIFGVLSIHYIFPPKTKHASCSSFSVLEPVQNKVTICEATFSVDVDSLQALVDGTSGTGGGVFFKKGFDLNSDWQRDLLQQYSHLIFSRYLKRPAARCLNHLPHTKLALAEHFHNHSPVLRHCQKLEREENKTSVTNFHTRSVPKRVREMESKRVEAS